VLRSSKALDRAVDGAASSEAQPCHEHDVGWLWFVIDDVEVNEHPDPTAKVYNEFIGL